VWSPQGGSIGVHVREAYVASFDAGTHIWSSPFKDAVDVGSVGHDDVLPTVASAPVVDDETYALAAE